MIKKEIMIIQDIELRQPESNANRMDKDLMPDSVRHWVAIERRRRWYPRDTCRREVGKIMVEKIFDEH